MNATTESFRAGDIAGYIDRRSGRRLITLDGVRYRAADIAWKLCTGRDPVGEIMHRDGDRANDRLANLYDAGDPLFDPVAAYKASGQDAD